MVDIYLQKYNIIIEVNGPIHYVFSDSDILTLKSQMKILNL